MYTFFLARKVYTLSKELYSTVKKDVLSMGWGGVGGAVQEDCFKAAMDERQPHTETQAKALLTLPGSRVLES